MNIATTSRPVKAPSTADIYAATPTYDAKEKQQKIQQLTTLLHKTSSVLIAHYYVDEAIQELAEHSGGFIGDSLEMARFGKEQTADNLIVAGVRFMGETAKILSPDKHVFMPTLEATCSLDESCPSDLFDAFCNEHSDRTVVVYANTSAAVKARADWVTTSSIALKIIGHLMDENKKILWAPDKYLGRYIQHVTGADILLWQGSCVVHEEFKYKELAILKQRYPQAAILVHPESPLDVIEQADVVGSTSTLIKAVQQMDNPQFIVATDNRIFYKMRQFAGDKELIEAPTAGAGATCHSCAHCPWMAMNNLDNLEQTITQRSNEIKIDETIRQKASISTSRMMDFA